MLLLGIDTSGKVASADLFDTENEIFLAQSSLYTQKTHSQVIMPMVKDILAKSDKQMSDIGAIAVANGPGSYTGLRIGVAAVKAMCFGLGIKCCGVSTLSALAFSNMAFVGNICSIMKARGELVYTCSYKSDGFTVKPICEEKLISRDKLSKFLALDQEGTLLCGDGAADFFNDYRSPLFTLAPPQSRLQNATGVCLAVASASLIDPELLEVSYLQKVKAEKDLEDRSKTN